MKRPNLTLDEALQLIRDLYDTADRRPRSVTITPERSGKYTVAAVFD